MPTWPFWSKLFGVWIFQRLYNDLKLFLINSIFPLSKKKWEKESPSQTHGVCYARKCYHPHNENLQRLPGRVKSSSSVQEQIQRLPLLLQSQCLVNWKFFGSWLGMMMPSDSARRSSTSTIFFLLSALITFSFFTFRFLLFRELVFKFKHNSILTMTVNDKAHGKWKNK